MGLRYYEALRRLIDEQDALEAEIKGTTLTPRGLLRIAAPTNLGERHLAGWALEFQRMQPEVTIEMLLDDRYVDVRAAGIDIALRIGKLADSALTARRLGAMELALVASAAYLKENHTPRSPVDLEAHQFVLFSFLQTGDRLTLTGPRGAKEEIAMRARFSVNNVGAIERVVLDGAGIHAGPLWLFGPAIAEGRLIRVLPMEPAALRRARSP